MRLLLLNQFYPPDVAPTGMYLHDVAKELVRRGHEVHVVASRRSYDGGSDFPAETTLNGVQIHRVAASGFGRRSFAGKVADYLSFATSLSKKIGTLPKPDLTLACTTPPWIGLAAPTPHAHWIMDLYPDALAAAGMPGTAALRPLTRRELKGARLVLALGPFMAKRVVRYAPNVEWVPLWAPEGLEHASPNPSKELVLMYSGNMGMGHRFGEFLEASLRTKKTKWVFSGGGKRRAQIEVFARRHPDAAIELRPYSPRNQLQEHLATADVHLISLDPAWQGLMVPSKIQGIFAVGRPAIFVGDAQNEIAGWIAESQAGWVIAPGDVDGFLRALDEARDREVLRKKGTAAHHFSNLHFDRATNIAKVATLVEQAV